VVYQPAASPQRCQGPARHQAAPAGSARAPETGARPGQFHVV